MPCLKCKKGLWKFGKSGKCQYESKQSCETANADYYEGIDEYDQDFDYEFNFSQAQMDELHENGKVIVNVKEKGEEINILFTNNPDEKTLELAKITQANTKKYKKIYGIKRT